MFGLQIRFHCWVPLAILLLNASQLRIALAQGGCACQPGEITFTLDFSLTCADTNVLSGDPGVNETLCSVFPTDDPVPVSVSTISVTEVATNYDVIRMVNFSDFSSGDNFTYVSFSVTNSTQVEDGIIPIALQVTIIGENADGEIVSNFITIVYSNECTIYPVLDAGSQIGWTTITDVVAPPAKFCPAAPDSIVPSTVPSSIPSSSPVISDKCLCQPNQITFVLDFGLECDESSIRTGDPGIEEAECVVASPNRTSFDPTPVTLESVFIWEVDQNLNLINLVNFTKSFSSGETITYDSFVTTDEFIGGGIIPKGLSVRLNGVNGDGEEVSNFFVILYTNECTIYPVLEDGEQIGWTKLQMLVPPSPEFCPGVMRETDTPSTVPSDVPSAMPSSSIVPSNVPSAVPSSSIVPSNVPSLSPSMSIVPSDVPSDPFTMAPSDPMLETDAPVKSPVMPPAEAPVDAETDAPFKSPVMPPTKGMKKEGMMMMEGMKKDMSSMDNMSMDIPKNGMMMGGKGMSNEGGTGKGMSSDSMGKGMSKEGSNMGKGMSDESNMGKGMSGESNMGKGMSTDEGESENGSGKGGKGKEKRKKEKVEHKDKLHIMMEKSERRQLRHTSD